MSELAADHASSGGAAPPDAVSAWAVRAQQLAALSREAPRIALGTVIGAGLTGYVASGITALWHIAIWVVCVCGIAITQLAFAQRAARTPASDAAMALDASVLLMFAAGVAVATGPALLFAHLPPQRQILLTLVVMCWAAMALPIAGSYARAFHAYALAILTPLGLAWTAAGSLDSVLAGVLLAVFGIVLAGLARGHARTSRASMELSDHCTQLTDALAHAHRETALARRAAQSAEKAKSRFLSAVGHDLRQPLHALSMYSAAMQLRRLEGDMANIGRNINEAVSALSALVDSLLDIARLDAGTVRPKRQRIELKPFLEQIASDMRPAARSRGLELRSAICDADIDGDATLLERLVRNLVDNAIKYTVAGGVTLCCDVDDGDVRIAIQDTGPGIRAEDRERIFEEFYQVGNPQRDRAQGLGVGLAVVRRLAALLNVRVELETIPGAGSTFALRMRRAAPERIASRISSANDEDRSLEGAEILVIDDEPAVRDSMRTLFDSWGCRVRACGSLAEAKDALRDAAHGLDIIVSDLRLREHENGIDTVRELQALMGPVPALLISGETAPETLRAVQASGLTLLHKPVPAAKLREALLALLSECARREK